MAHWKDLAVIGYLKLETKQIQALGEEGEGLKRKVQQQAKGGGSDHGSSPFFVSSIPFCYYQFRMPFSLILLFISASQPCSVKAQRCEGQAG
jgi:hypothetical protein